MSAAPKLSVVTASQIDDAVRERHGCRCRDASDDSLSSVTVWEGDQTVFLDSDYHNRAMTAWQARYLASKLYRLSRRIRQRTEQSS